ncbi:hypothetical protein [Oceanobacter mangrovi]|uniref:hypothetical protein n=1 Tax=Oceanobacter mangrovi TaxID=2862510 RepID=UPI001C8D2D2F|nr:hypothetical protein [Oceanobacter mangrovi]
MSDNAKRPNKVDGVLQGYLDDLLLELPGSSGKPAAAERYNRPPAPPAGVENRVQPQAARSPQPEKPAMPRFAEPEPPKPVLMPPVVVAETAVEKVVADKSVSEKSVAEKVIPIAPAAKPQTELAQPAVALKVAEAKVVTPPLETKPVARTRAPVVPSAPDVSKQAVNKATATSVPEATLMSQKNDTAAALASLNWQSGGGVDCLIFIVCGLKLAIPLPWLGGVHRVSDKITPLFGQARWSLGVWQGEKGKLTIVDSALLMMPERQRSLQDEGYEYFIQLDRSPWAVACQQICDTVKLDQNAIKWRGERSKRPWLAGTVIDEMCALIDVPGLLGLLEDNRRPKRAGAHQS